jgi:hypothetical protein
MALTKEQRRELNRLGVQNVALQLQHAGPGTHKDVPFRGKMARDTGILASFRLNAPYVSALVA